MLQETIAALEEQCKKELASMPRGAIPDSAMQSLDSNPVYENLRLQLSSSEIELASLK